MTTADKIDVAHVYCLRLLNGRRRATSRLAAYLGSLIHESDWTEGEIYDLQMRLILTLAERMALLPDSVSGQIS